VVVGIAMVWMVGFEVSSERGRIAGDHGTILGFMKTVQCIAGMIIAVVGSCFGGGQFKPIYRASAHQNDTYESFHSRPGFAPVRHRGTARAAPDSAPA